MVFRPWARALKAAISRGRAFNALNEEGPDGLLRIAAVGRTVGRTPASGGWTLFIERREALTKVKELPVRLITAKDSTGRGSGLPRLLFVVLGTMLIGLVS